MSKLPKMEAMELVQQPNPFDHEDWFYEVKYDGLKWSGFPEQLSAFLKCTGCGLRAIHGASAARKRLRARSVGNPVFMLPSISA